MDDMSDKYELFTAMAESISRNSDFGGAFVVVPPEGAGEPLSTLILDGKPDPAQFWQMLLTKCQIMIAEIEAAKRGFGRR